MIMQSPGKQQLTRSQSAFTHDGAITRTYKKQVIFHVLYTYDISYSGI